MITHSRTWLEVKVGDDPRHQHVMEVILQVRPCDIPWFQEHATPARHEIQHLLSTVILPKSPCGEEELEVYYRKRGYLLPMSLQQQQQKIRFDSTRGAKKKTNTKKKSQKRAVGCDEKANAKKKATTGKRKSVVSVQNDDEDEDEEDEGEDQHAEGKQEQERQDRIGNHTNNTTTQAKLDANQQQAYHQAFGETLRIVYRTEPIVSSSSTTTASGKSAAATAFLQSSTLFWKHHTDDSDHQTNHKSAGLLQQLPKLSHRFWLWCYPKSANDDDNKDEPGNNSCSRNEDLTLHPGWNRNDMIPMASLFRPPADYKDDDDDDNNK